MRIADVVAEAGRASQGLVTAGDLRRAGSRPGALTRALRAGELVRVRRGVYSPNQLPPWPRFVVTESGPSPAYVAQVRAVLLSLGPGAAASSRTAAALWQWGMLVEPARTVEVAVGRGRSRVRLAGVRVVQRRNVVLDRVVVLAGTDPLWVTSAEQTVVDCCVELPLLEAVTVCDSTLRARATTAEALLGKATQLRGIREAGRVREVLGLCDPACGSVPESVLRVRLLQAGVTGFDTQRVLVERDGRHVLRTDFCFAEARLVVEVDGARWHEDRARDRATDNRLACLGWRVLRYGWREVVHEHRAVVAEIRKAVDWRVAA